MKRLPPLMLAGGLLLAACGVRTTIGTSHFPSFTVTCQTGLDASGQQYVAGAQVTGTFDPGTTHAVTLTATATVQNMSIHIPNPDPTEPHTWHITFTSPDGAQYHVEYPGVGQNGTIPACATAPTTTGAPPSTSAATAPATTTPATTVAPATTTMVATTSTTTVVEVGPPPTVGPPPSSLVLPPTR